MKKIEKIIWSQDAFFKTEPRKSGETSINLSNEIFEFLGSVENGHITFKIFKEDYLKALCSLSLLLPLYTSSSKEATLKPYSNKFFDDCYRLILKKFGDSDSANYKVHSLKRDDGRIYLNELKESETGFNIRYFFVQSHSVVTFVQKDDGTYELRFRNSVTELSKDQISDTEEEKTLEIPDTFRPLLTAIRTKPFILLAGISGTGKSRIVRKLAQASVSEDLQKMYDPKSVEGGFNRWQLHKPANFELIQVKPNWHNSLEVVGYKSNIGRAHYEFTPFVEFVARAWKHPETPFFLCLDEMNLAPVEQYFAEFLSAIESRSIENNEYETDPIIKPFAEFGEDVCTEMLNHLLGKVDAAHVGTNSPEAKLVQRFRTKGLTLPQNLIILGTVNMDETTFSFSRKVLDRAMSIVMDDVDYESYFNGSSENNVPEMDEGIKQLIINRNINGLEAKDNDADAVKNYLTSINAILDKTPFKLGYRAANEALLYVSAAHSINSESSTNAALDEFTLMKILSRIEGDKRSIDNLLENLKDVINSTDYPKSYEVLDSMSKTLNSKQFVSYWTK